MIYRLEHLDVGKHLAKKKEKAASKEVKKRKRRVSSELTHRQEEVYQLINGRGLTPKEAAIELQCSPQNISNLLKKAEKKVNAKRSRSINLAKAQRLPTDERGQIHIGTENNELSDIGD